MNVFPRISLGFCTLLAVLASSSEGRADSNRVKGITGGALLGAEVALVTEAALGVQSGWLYAIGGVVGGGGGGLAGYYIGGSSSPKPPSFLLAGGIALVIPTLIGVVTATQFRPPDSYKPERTPDEDAPLAARLELPTLQARETFSADEVAMFRVPQQTALHVSLLRGVF